MRKKVVVIGASRGLGRALSKRCMADDNVESVLLVSRKADEALLSLKSKFFGFDLSSPNLEDLKAELELFCPTHVIYSAGGGPFSLFEKAKWQSHEWSIRVSFLALAELLHWFMGREESSDLHQFTAIGSSVAEDNPDPKAAAYAASKHALVGLHSSIVAENPISDFRLFSPGYMNTDMLPKGSWPRLQQASLWEPDYVAGLVWGWCCDSGQKNGHLRLDSFAEMPRNPQ